MNKLRDTLVLCALAATVVGCASNRHCRDACKDGCVAGCLPTGVGESPPKVSVEDWQRCAEPIPHGAVPAPPGTYLAAWREGTWAGAPQRHSFIYRNEWFSGGDQLSPEGIQHVGRITQSMLEMPNWVVIENEPVQLDAEETYDEALQRIEQLQVLRRNVIIEKLATAGVSDAASWVVFAEDRNVGVRGIEAPQVFNRQFLGNRRRGRGGLGRGGFGRWFRRRLWRWLWRRLRRRWIWRRRGFGGFGGGGIF